MSLPCLSSPVASTSSSRTTSSGNQETSTASTSAAAESESKEPQPGPSHSDEPRPGPSTTAADFDLEVFDSGSSCSIEDAWGLGCSPDDSIGLKSGLRSSRSTSAGIASGTRCRRKARRSSRGDLRKKSSFQYSESLVEFFTVADIDNSSEDNGECEAADMSLPPFDPPPASVCPSETEEAVSGDDHDEDDDEDDDLEDGDDLDEEEDDDEEECTCEGGPSATCWKCRPSTSGAAATLHTLTATASSTIADVQVGVASTSAASLSSEPDKATSTPDVEVIARSRCCGGKSPTRENIDEIVQDHDNFGTDENDDSMDSLALASGSVSMALYRPDSEDSIEDEASLFGPASKRKNLDESDRVLDSEQPTIKKKKQATISGRCFELQWTNSEANGGPSGLTHGGHSDFRHHPSTSSSSSEVFCCAKLFHSGSNEPAADDRLLEQRIFILNENLEREVCSPQPVAAVGAAGSAADIDGSEMSHVMPGDDMDELPPPSAAVVSWVDTFTRWSHCDKIVAINQLIRACHPTQVRHMMDVIAPQFQRDFISLLPKELALYVLSFLEPRDLLRAAQTCRYWRILAEDNLLWREKCRESGLSDVLETLNIRRKKSVANGFAYSTWKSGFMRQHNIEMNWRVRPIRSPRVLKGHDDHVITCLQFSGNRIVSGSDDNTLKVWNASTGKCLKTLVGHTGGVWSSQMEGNVIVSGSTDRTLKVWNADTGACVHTLYGHTSTVRCMHLHGNKVVSGSRDATLRMWDISSGECLHVLMGHVAAVRCVQYDGRLVVSGAYDYMVKVWNPEREECLHTLSGHTNRVYSLQFDGIHVVSGSLDTSIRVWDVETGACKHALMGHQSLTSGMELRDNILVSGNADSTVKVWDITTGQCLQTLSGPNKHQSAVTCLQFNSKFVITSSDDGTVKLWDVRSGEFLRDLVALESGGSGGVVWRIRANATRLVCAVGSRNGTEETKLLVLDFDVQDTK